MAIQVEEAIETRAARRGEGWSGSLWGTVGPVALLAALLAFWQWGLLDLFNVPRYLVPEPSQVAKALYDGYVHGTFFKHTWVTLKETLYGFGFGVVLGLGLGTLIAESKVLNRLLSPYIVGLNALPKVAIAPLMVVWFGQGMTSKVLVTSLVAFFPLLVNVTAGLQSVDSEQLDLLKAMTASRRQIFMKVKFRHALPQIFAGLEIAIVLAVVGAVVAEFVGAQSGLGYYIEFTLALVNPPGMFAMLVILSVMSYILYEIVHRIGRKLVFWQGVDRIGGEGL